eukprot:gnl/TRDRNA2_/TRDRNA2_141994_c0_seq1.p1 gnl/TRDRNA2_/TRDRNA2_141994_c0~~gnl/TRDRNA2_/TRDRNA2_141994_c0_seq1.p1  ORF type:complete len:254 (-),score=59.33 gnl/TRDRNA2_/TRDRNA2_141994_c0_seq1:215-976(-)
MGAVCCVESRPKDKSPRPPEAKPDDTADKVPKLRAEDEKKKAESETATKKTDFKPPPRTSKRPSVGDEVKIWKENDATYFSKSRLGTYGMVGKVIEDDKSGQPFKVEIGVGNNQWYCETWLGALPALGSEVLVVDENDKCKYSLSRLGTQGMVGKIIEVDKSDQPFKIDFGGGKLQWYKHAWVCFRPAIGDHVEVVIESDEKKFSLSRKDTKGMVGTLLEEDTSDQPYKIDLGARGTHWYKRGWVRLAGLKKE